mmetsp:Transcript_35187/g.92075  ORF Transcript_35187/g.92075 Transcript_35187/m.92075 type:complete len:656 (-) Transcript_35187:610-2577(-)
MPRNVDLPTVAEVCQHVAFLRAVHMHVTSVPQSDLFHDGPALRTAASAYVRWLRTDAAAGPTVTDGVAGTPPLPVAWVWHCHRLAPLKYLSDCRARGNVIQPAAAAFAWSACDEPGPGLQEQLASTSGIETAADHALIDDLVRRSTRQAKFLWQVSGEAYSDPAFLAGAISRYGKFLQVVAKSKAKRRGPLAPPVDVDLVWHTHMLRGAGVEAYAKETARLCGGRPLDHDDSVGTGVSDLWQTTKELWRNDDEDAATRIGSDPLVLEKAVRPGAVRRDDPPPWWFDASAPIVVVKDNFLSPAEVEALVEQMPQADEAVVGGGGAARGRGFGKDARCTVSVDATLERRIMECVATSLGMPTDEPPPAPAAELIDAFDSEAEAPRLPARVSVGHMGPHRDRLAVATDSGAMLGPYADGYVAVVYLRGGGSLVLHPDESGECGAWLPPHAHAALSGCEVEIKPGRLVAWPNYGVLHSGKADNADAAAARWILGPVAIVPGRARLAQSGDCGGGCSGAPKRRAAPDPPTNSVHAAQDFDGTYSTGFCCPGTTWARVNLKAVGPDEISVASRVAMFPICIPCCSSNEHYVRDVENGEFTANGGTADGRFHFSEDRMSVTWSFCCVGRMTRTRDSPPPPVYKGPRTVPKEVIESQPQQAAI